MTYNAEKNVALLKQVVAEEYVSKSASDPNYSWEKAAEVLSKLYKSPLCYDVTARSAKDRFKKIYGIFQKDKMASLRKSGTD